MPFKSKAQMRLLFAKHPEIAKRWAKEYDTPSDLPEHVKKKAKMDVVKKMLKKKSAK